METQSKMASVIRSNAKWPVVITSIVMAITIGSVGISELINSKGASGDIYLSNWKTSIKQKEWQEIYNQEIFYLQFGEQAKFYLNKITLDTALQTKDAERKKIEVTNEEIKAKISGDKNFQDDKGKFDPKKYDESLDNRYKIFKNTTARRIVYEKKVRNDILKDKLKDFITKNVTPSEQDIKNDFHNKFDSVEYDYLAINTDLKDAPEPTKEEVKAYYDKNAKSPEFQTEKSVKIKYVFFPFSKFEVDAPKEEEIQAYYDSNKAKYVEADAHPGEDKDKTKEPQYKPLKSVKNEIIQKMTDERLKLKASSETEKIHTAMSAITNDKKEVDIKKAFETVKPANGTFGESTYFSQNAGGNELAEKFGDIKNLRAQAIGSVGKTSLKRINLDKGIVFYFANKEDVKEPTLKSLEECKANIVSDLKTQKSWEIAKKKADDLANIGEKDGWEKTVTAQKLTPLNQKVVINEAAAKHKGIVTALIENKINTGKILVEKSNEGMDENCYYVIFFKDRVPATDEKFKKEKTDIKNALDSTLKAAKWEQYTENLGKEAGLPEDDKKK